MGFLGRLLAPQNLDITTSEGLSAFVRGSGKTWSGMEISVAEAMKDPAWFSGSRNIPEDIGKLPFILYEAGDSRQRATSNPYWKLIHDKVAARWTSQQFREYMTFWALQNGDSFALKNVIGGVIRELMPIKAGECDKELTGDGEFVYHVKLNGKRETLDRRHVFHLEGFAMNVDGGAQLFRQSREDIALSLAAERHGATYFGNGSHPGLSLSIPGELSTAAYERMQASLREDHTGANSWNPFLLEGGAKWDDPGDSAEASQFTETRLYQVQQHGRRLRVPPLKLGDYSQAHYATAEQDAVNYAVDTILPWTIRWENAMNQQVIVTNSVYAELSFEGLLRANSVDRAEFYAKAIQSGYMTQNEVRRRENLPPLPGGDVLFTQVNLASPQERKYREFKTQAEATSILVKCGFEPKASLKAAGMPEIEHTGVIPSGGVGSTADEQQKELVSA